MITTGNRLVLVPSESLRKRFWSRVEQRDIEDCWNWLACTRNGYGAIKHDGHVFGAHVVAYVLSNGVNPIDGNVIAHTCDNKLCCNPMHLESIPYGQNNRDARERLHFYVPQGELAPQAVLTDEIVRQMRAVAQEKGWGHRRVARAFNAHPSTVKSVLLRKSWKHV